MNPALANRLAQKGLIASPTGSPSRKRPLGDTMTLSPGGKGQPVVLVHPNTLGNLSLEGKPANFEGMEPISFNRNNLSASVSKLGPGQKMFIATPYSAPSTLDAMAVTTKPPWSPGEDLLIRPIIRTRSTAYPFLWLWCSVVALPD